MLSKILFSYFLLPRKYKKINHFFSSFSLWEFSPRQRTSGFFIEQFQTTFHSWKFNFHLNFHDSHKISSYFFHFNQFQNFILATVLILFSKMYTFCNCIHVYSLKNAPKSGSYQTYEARYGADFRFFEILVNMVNAVNVVNMVFGAFSSCFLFCLPTICW